MPHDHPAEVISRLIEYWFIRKPDLTFGQIIQLIQAAGDKFVIHMEDAEVSHALRKLKEGDA